MGKTRTAFLLTLALLGSALVAAAFGPIEGSLGRGVRSVYLHGAWVWTAILGFLASGILGLTGAMTGRPPLPQWSIALGRCASLFWVSYLPLSLWTMQLNWNGLFLEEPRWRLGVNFAVIALLIQLAITLLDRPRLAGVLNSAYALSLCQALLRADQVMHPPSPILASDSRLIQTYFFALTLLCVAAAWQLSRWLYFKFSKPS